MRESVEALAVDWRGRRDGRRGIPSKDDVEPPYERARLQLKGDMRVSAIAAACVLAKGDLEGEFCGLLEKLASKHGPAIAAAEGELQRRNERVLQLEQELIGKRAALRLRREQQREEVTKRWRIGPGVFKVALAVIVAAEVVLNSIVFRVFGDNEVYTAITSLGLTAGVVFLAHIDGVLLAQEDVTLRDRTLAASISSLAVGSFVLFGILREHYLEIAGSSPAPLTFNGQPIPIPDIGTTISLGPVLGPLVFTVANAIIFLAAVALSYFHYDPDWSALRRLLHELRHERLERWLASLKAARRHKKAMPLVDRVYEIASEWPALFEAYRHWAQRQRHRYSNLWKRYGSANLRVRRRDRRIPTLATELDIKMPEVLAGACPPLKCDGVRRQLEEMIRTRWEPRGWRFPGFGPSLEKGDDG